MALFFDPAFYRGKNVFVTGHTGFKGAWLSVILETLGANVTGYALLPTTEPDLYSLSSAKEKMHSVIGDIRDKASLEKAFFEAKPEIVLHLAAQPIVRTGYLLPAETFETNVMGTVNILECIRKSDTVRSFLNVTTDKVYLNREWERGYTEDDELDGFDPYSNSKSCSELVTHSYKRSFFGDGGIAVSTARAGNVIGGGDFAKDRIIPDCVRAVSKNEKITVRNPYSTRPYQHVLEPLFAYLMIASRQFCDTSFSGYYNVGPDDADCFETGKLVSLFCEKWGEGASWENKSDNGPHEAGFLKLDCAKIKNVFGWRPTWDLEEAVEKTVSFEKERLAGGNAEEIIKKQIKEFSER